MYYQVYFDRCPVKDSYLQKWDARFLDLAFHVAQWSKDPSTKVGAVIVRPDNRVVSLGYNGFPRGVCDHEERYTERAVKYKFVSHAERNALDNISEDVTGCTLYSTLQPCPECAKSIIQKGIKRVVTNLDLDRHEMLDELYQYSYIMFKEADVTCLTVVRKDGTLEIRDGRYLVK